MKLIVPKEMGFILSPFYFYIYLIALSIQTVVTRKFIHKIIPNPNITSAVGGYNQSLSLYLKPLLLL